MSEVDVILQRISFLLAVFSDKVFSNNVVFSVCPFLHYNEMYATTKLH